jgi:hypothetical protein
MCLDRIADCVPRFVAHPRVMPKLQVDKTFVFFEGDRDREECLVSDGIAGLENGRPRGLQTTVSGQTIRENTIVQPAERSLQIEA